MKIERLLAIIVLLLNRRRVTARELAERFEVSVRTIYRDVETLNGAGVPVISTQGHEGGLTIPDNYKLSRQLLTFDDMLSILSTLQGVNRTMQNNDLLRIIEKISALIPEDKELHYRTYSDSFVIDIAPWGMSEIFRVTMQIVHEAVGRSLLLGFTYTDAGGQESLRLVEPHTLIYKSFTWYLLAYCRERLDFRLFRLSRMRDPKHTREHFIRREVGALNRFAERDNRPLVELIVKFCPAIQVKVEEHFGPSHLHYEEDGSIIATLTFPEDDWILSFLLSFGSDAQVLSPLRWREAVAKKVTEMQKLYSSLT
ncbi:MAG: YafY family transcriptional regulator [Proteobacteria bacterium]|nr:YafY family transcriptional regulator [Pseudomonadota bacterium]